MQPVKRVRLVGLGRFHVAPYRLHDRRYLNDIQGVKGELLKLAGSLLLVYGVDTPELTAGARTMLGWCDSALSENAKNKKVEVLLAGMFLL